MKWNRAKGRKDRHVIDARGSSPPARSGGGLGGLPIPGGVAGIGGGAGVVVLIVIVAIQVFGGGGSGGFDLGPAFGSGAQAPGTDEPGRDPARRGPPARPEGVLHVYVFNDAQETWDKIFRQEGAAYEPATALLYANAVRDRRLRHRRRRPSARSTARPIGASTSI